MHGFGPYHVLGLAKELPLLDKKCENRLAQTANFPGEKTNEQVRLHVPD